MFSGVRDILSRSGQRVAVGRLKRMDAEVAYGIACVA